MILFFFRARSVELLEQLLLRLVLAHHHLVHVPAVEAIAMANQLSNQLEGPVVLRVAHHLLHNGLQAEVVHVNVEDAIQAGNGLVRLVPIHFSKVRERELLRFVIPNVLFARCLLGMVGDVDESLRNLLSFLQRQAVVIGVGSLRMKHDKQDNVIGSHGKTNEDVELRLVEVVVYPHGKAFIAEEPRLLGKGQQI